MIIHYNVGGPFIYFFILFFLLSNMMADALVSMCVTPPVATFITTIIGKGGRL